MSQLFYKLNMLHLVTRTKLPFFLYRKVFKKLHFELADDVIKQIVNAKPFVIERVLLMLRSKIDNALWEKENSDRPEVDQHDDSM